MVDTPDLGSGAARRAGSNPVPATRKTMPSFLSEKFIFVHFPKTGGMWFYHLCQMWGIPILELAPSYKSHKTAVYFKDSANWNLLPWIVFYRNPLDWYTSLYNYHIKMDWWWRPTRRGLGFHQFVEVCLAEKPYSQGWYEMVIEPKQKREHSTGQLRWCPPTYMIQYENMYEELEIVMRDILGYPQFTKEILAATRKRNTRSQRGYRGKPPNTYCPALTPELRKKIMKIDKPIFDLYENHDAIVAKWQTR